MSTVSKDACIIEVHRRYLLHAADDVREIELVYARRVQLELQS